MVNEERADVGLLQLESTTSSSLLLNRSERFMTNESKRICKKNSDLDDILCKYNKYWHIRSSILQNYFVS
jgi:hypothetical protein